MPGGFQHESVPTVPLANTPDVAVDIRGRVVNASGSVLWSSHWSLYWLLSFGNITEHLGEDMCT